jgi:hypothetical protein
MFGGWGEKGKGVSGRIKTEDRKKERKSDGEEKSNSSNANVRKGKKRIQAGRWLFFR